MTVAYSQAVTINCFSAALSGTGRGAVAILVLAHVLVGEPDPLRRDMR
jgi:hypothetical protein